MSFRIKNENCELEATRRPFNELEHANHYFLVTKISGTWPSDQELMVACDNMRFGEGDRTFGGKVEYRGDARYVTVYVD